MSCFRFPFWPVRQTEEGACQRPENWPLRATLALSPSNPLAWLCRVGARVEWIWKFSQVLFRPWVLPSLLHISSYPDVGAMFQSCRWETGMLRDGVASPWSEREQQSKEPSCYPSLCTGSSCSDRSPSAKLVSLCNAALSFSLGLLFSRKSSGWNERVLRGCAFLLGLRCRETGIQTVIPGISFNLSSCCASWVVKFWGLDSWDRVPSALLRRCPLVTRTTRFYSSSGSAAKSQSWKGSWPHLGPSLMLCCGHCSGFMLKDQDPEGDPRHRLLTPLFRPGVQGLHSKWFLTVP